MEPTGVPIRFSTGGPLLHIEFAQASIGVHNEYFLHHRRRGRCTSRCRLPWSARLKNKILFDLSGKRHPRLLAELTAVVVFRVYEKQIKTVCVEKR